MTTQKFLKPDSNRHSFWVAFKTGLPLAVVGAVGFFLLIWAVNIHHINPSDYSKFQYVYIHMQEFMPFTQVCEALYGAAMAILIFSFQMRKKAATFYFTLGIRRKTLFFSRFAAGLLLVFIPVIITAFADMIFNINTFGLKPGTVGAGLYFMLGFCTVGFVGYSAGTLACALSGTLLEGSLFSAVLLCGPSLMITLLNQLMKVFLAGNTYGVQIGREIVPGKNPSLFDILRDYNPLVLFTSGLEQYTGKRADGLGLFTGRPILPVNPTVTLAWVLIGVGVTLLALNFFLRRRAEIGGQMGNSRVVNYIISFMLGFTAFSLIACAYDSGFDMVWCLLLATIAFILIFAVTHLILRRNLRLLLKDAIGLPVELALTFVVFIVLATGLFGYSSWLPATSDVKKMTISYQGDPKFTDGGAAFGGLYYDFDGDATCTTPKDIKLAVGLHKELIEEGRPQLRGNGVINLDRSSVIPIGVEVTYILKDGSTVSRAYDRTTMGVAADMLSLDSTDAVHKQMIESISGKYSQFGQSSIYLVDRYYSGFKKLSIENRPALLEAIQKDILSLSIQQRYYPTSQPLGVLLFTNQTEAEPNLENIDYLTNKVLLTPDYVNTLAFLKANKVEMPSADIEPDITSIDFVHYSAMGQYCVPSKYFIGILTNFVPLSDDKLNHEKYTVDDQSKISELLPKLQNARFTLGGGYIAVYKPKGKDQYVTMFLPSADAPDYIKQNVK